MKLLISLLLLLVPMSCVPAFALGWENGNAGDAVASEFILTGRDVLQRLQLLFKNDKPVFDPAKLRAVIKSTEVTSVDRVFLRGLERDAENFYPTRPLIKVSRTRWTDLRRSTRTKDRLRLVLHEYLWMSGKPDKDFSESDHLIELLNIKNYSPDIWWNPVNPLNYVAPTLSFAPEGCAMQPVSLRPTSQDETVDIESSGSCGDAYRKLHIVKTAGITPASSNVRGLFHSFALTVTDAAGNKLGEMTFEPEWGKCLLPEEGSCQASGKMTIGGVEIVFWFLRES
jgi:hypothetical protein